MRRVVSVTRAALIAKGSNIYKEKIDKKRELFKKEPINYAGMKTSTHAVSCDELSNDYPTRLNRRSSSC